MDVGLTGFRFADDERVPVEDGAGRAIGRVVRLSPASVALVPQVALANRVTLRLDGVPPLDGHVVDERILAGERIAQIELSDVEIHTARAIAAQVRRFMAFRAGLVDDDYCVAREKITDAGRVREIVRTLFANRSAGRIKRGDGRDGKGIRLTPARLCPESPTPLQWEAEQPWFAPPFMIELDGYVSRFRFTVEEAHNVDGFLAVALPRTIERLRSRHQRRVPAPAGVIVSLRHPRWPELRIERPVLNVSLDGLSFATSVFKDLLWPGLKLPELTVTWQDRLVCRLEGEVRHVSEDIDAPSELCGVSIGFASPDDVVHWRRRVDGLLRPDTSADGTWSRPLWELYRDSGYFNLSHKTERDFVDLRPTFETTSRKLAAAPELGCQVVWPSARGLEASLSLLRTYQQGTFLYHLARRPGRAPLRYPGRKILRDIYTHGLEHVGEDPSLRWLVVWVQEEARFSRLVHHVLTARYAETGRAEVVRFRALEGRCDVPLAPPDELRVGVATAEESAMLVDAVARRHSRAFAEAHDLVSERLGFEEVMERWAQAGLLRERHLLVARARDRAVAAAVIEVADDGLHLFALLDLVRLYPLVDGGETAFPALLEASRAFYAQRGKRRFVYFQQPDRVEATRGLPLADLGAADCTLLPRELWPELLEHVWEATSPRDMPPWVTS